MYRQHVHCLDRRSSSSPQLYCVVEVKDLSADSEAKTYTLAHPRFPARPPVGTASGHEATAADLAPSREGRQHQSQSGGSLPGPESEVQARPRRCMSLDSALSWAGQGSASSLDGSLDAGQQPASCQDVLSSHIVQQAAAYGVGGSVEGCEGGVGQTPPPLVWHPPAPPVSHRCRLALAPRGRRSRSKGRVVALPTKAAHLDEHGQNLGAMQKQQQKCQDQRQQQRQQQQQQQQQDDHHRKKHQQPPQQQHRPKGQQQQQVGRCCVAQRALPTRHAAPCRVRGTSPDSVLNTHSAFTSPACQHHTAGAASASSLPLALPGAPPSSQLLDLSLLQPLSPVLSTPLQSDVLATFIAATSSICPITPAASAHTSLLDCGEERRMRHRLARAGIATYLQPAVPHGDTAAAERDSPVRARSTLFRREALLSGAGGVGAEGCVGSGGGGVAAAGAASALGRHSLGAKKEGGLGAALRAAGRLLSKQLSALSAW